MSKIDKKIPKRFRLEYIFTCFQEEFERIAGLPVEVKVGERGCWHWSRSSRRMYLLGAFIYGPGIDGIDALPFVCMDMGSLGRTLGTFAWTVLGYILGWSI